jgi:hypothetical protein
MLRHVFALALATLASLSGAITASILGREFVAVDAMGLLPVITTPLSHHVRRVLPLISEE